MSSRNHNSAIPMPHPGSGTFGLHLAGPPYHDDIRELLSKYPTLRYADDKRYEVYPFQQPLAGQSRVACVEFRSASTIAHRIFPSEQALDAFLAQPPPAGTRRFFLLEELQPSYVTVLGHRLRIPPTVISQHRRKALWEYDHDAGNTPALPSLRDPSTQFCFQYWELLWFLRDQIRDFYLRCAPNERHIAVSRIDSRFDNVGIVQRKVSFWAKVTKGDGWDAILIVDGPVKEALVGSGQTFRRAEMPNEAFQGGYADFINYTSLEEAKSTPGPPRTSLFDDLLYYYSHHSDCLTITASPASSTLFVRKIVASHFMMLGEYYRGVLSHLEWLLSRRETFANLTLDWVEERCSDLHSFNRRCDEYESDIAAVLEQMGIEQPESEQTAERHRQGQCYCGGVCSSSCDGPVNTARDWTSSRPDFVHLSTRFAKLKRRSASLLTSFTNLASIVGNRQSLSEARSVRALTYLGLTFVPLSFVTSLFSMNDAYLPGSSSSGGAQGTGGGGKRFWIAAVVAAGLVLCVFWLSFITTKPKQHAKVPGHHRRWWRRRAWSIASSSQGSIGGRKASKAGQRRSATRAGTGRRGRRTLLFQRGKERHPQSNRIVDEEKAEPIHDDGA
ncbi:uncharacterized protein Z518_04754 [Rhinocladiella mackenziei CBS 650.93]|uniref:Uncharacterized protein n=1 Tax=Rhinocladiella mackenziei CBS 650.93 TaxID=1442369 RepID=A0A0D2H8I7_9EURO|nr:uncharacterized protein Z518_04754 [Rhinocladiella mackenziei CBS 650.93]KIX06778.1 hypothetical protein Z518_04754 [Rhinocladiella mackenziei CBS 650.93]